MRAAANGGGLSRSQSTRAVAGVAELGSLAEKWIARAPSDASIRKSSGQHSKRILWKFIEWRCFSRNARWRRIRDRVSIRPGHSDV